MASSLHYIFEFSDAQVSVITRVSVARVLLRVSLEFCSESAVEPVLTDTSYDGMDTTADRCLSMKSFVLFEYEYIYRFVRD